VDDGRETVPIVYFQSFHDRDNHDHEQGEWSTSTRRFSNSSRMSTGSQTTDQIFSLRILKSCADISKVPAKFDLVGYRPETFLVRLVCSEFVDLFEETR
jgi:hypothetical protein